MTTDPGDPSAFVRIAHLTHSFYAWEQRGRGWDVYPYAVALEPPFKPFHLVAQPLVLKDDARRDVGIGAWLRSLWPDVPSELKEQEPESEPDVRPARRTRVVELQIALAPDVKVSVDLAQHFLVGLSNTADLVSFEIIGTCESIAVQLACSETDLPHVREQARAFFPDAVLSESAGYLVAAWRGSVGASLVVDFGLSREFMQPLRAFSRFDTDPLTGLVGSLAELSTEEVAVLQVLFQGTREPWQASILRSITDIAGESFFLDAPELLSQAKQKVSHPLYSAVLRVAVRSRSASEALNLARRVGGTLSQFGSPGENELIALSNDDYPDDAHVEDVFDRRSRRSGMILNSEELVALVHPPSTSVRSERLKRDQGRTKVAPKSIAREGFVIGQNVHGGVSRPIALTEEQRLRHTHVVGASGTGKSTLLLRMLTEDLERGNGVAVLDPHGDLIDDLLWRIPDARRDDVILIDPADVERPVGFNILSAHSELEKTLLSSDLVAVFKRLSTSWGDQMTSVLGNAVLAFLESTRGGTLADLRRFLVESEYRKEFLQTVTDPEVVYYWQKEFPLLTGRPQGPLLTRLDAFLRPRLIRGMVTQKSSIDFSAVMNEGRILLVKLAQGAIGEENAALLGSLFLAKFHQLALGRQSLAEQERRPFYLYCDEFQHFITPSMATLLTGARKYKLGLVLAHQELRQLWNQDRDVAGAVLSNAATRICFRVGDDDAKKLEDGFTSFSARDLQNLGRGQAIARIDRADWDFSLNTEPLPNVTDEGRARRTEVVSLSRERYGGSPSAHVEPRAPVLDEVIHVEVSPVPRLSTSEPRLKAAVKRPLSAHTPLPGRGGGQHKYLQELIRRWGDANGWKVEVEKAILDGLGSVDVSLERGDNRVACEVSVTSTSTYEVSNVRKCISAGFAQVILVTIDRKSESRLRTVLLRELNPSEVSKVEVVRVEELFDFLGKLQSSSVSETTTKGYRVKTRKGSGGSSTPAQAVARTVVSALKRLRTPSQE